MTNGIITTIAGNGREGYSGDCGPAEYVTLNFPSGIAVSGTGEIYIADERNNCIRVIFNNGTISSIVGNSGIAGYSGDGGPSTDEQLHFPSSVSISPTGEIYIADTFNNRIRRVFCEPGYTGYNCQLIACCGINRTETSHVCSGNGKWTAPNNCQCHSGYTEYNCQLITCYGLDATSSDVYSGHGVCE